MMEMLTNLVTQSGVGATQLSAILLGVLFLTMIIGLATGQELAFVLGGAGVIIGYLAWGGPGITIAMTKVYDQMQSYSMVAIPMFVLMANFLTHSTSVTFCPIYYITAQFIFKDCFVWTNSLTFTTCNTTYSFTIYYFNCISRASIYTIS